MRATTMARSLQSNSDTVVDEQEVGLNELVWYAFVCGRDRLTPWYVLRRNV